MSGDSFNRVEKHRGITLIPSGLEEQLNPRQFVDYQDHRQALIDWGLTFGKDPEDAEGYATNTMSVRMNRIHNFYEWVWDDRGYTTVVTHEEADDYLDELAHSDQAQDSRANTLKALKTLFKWHQYEHGWDEWEPKRTFSNSSSTTAKREFLAEDERKRVREASLEYGSVPHYNSVTPERRDQIKTYLASRFNIAKDDVTREHWDRANSWKIPSLVFASLDCALRPVEIERATVDWVDIDNQVLRIPAPASQKDKNEWESAIREWTAQVLERWLEQRSHIEQYEDTDVLWLTREGNPYDSHSLSYVLNRLCEEAGINTDNRSISWYSIRRSTATYMIDSGDISTAQNQCRHKDPRSTMRYDQAPPEKRRDVLDDIG